ncbi:MAG: DUF2971 domain-containing protein [Aurantimonas endophytica]
MDFTAEQLRVFQIFFPYAFGRQMLMRSTGKRFVHYTTAEAAFSVIRNREVWMRKSAVMNDFSETEHGLRCLAYAYNSENGQRFKALLDSLFPNLTTEVEEIFNSHIPHFRWETYLTCMSEHEDGEDTLGRLSMWRAYAGTTGVAVVMNPMVFLTPSDALRAYSNPVAYLTPEQFKAEFDNITDAIEKNADFVRSLGKDNVLANVFAMLRSAVLCTKHPGFHEEREWRIIYSPTYEQSDRIEKAFVTVGGTPQTICKIPLLDVPEEDLIGASVPLLVNRIIIGPSHYGAAMQEAFVGLLDEAGVKDAASKVWVSDIPLRVGA